MCKLFISRVRGGCGVLKILIFWVRGESMSVWYMQAFVHIHIYTHKYNLRAHTQVRVGLNDTTVDFWDPAKAVAKLEKALSSAGLLSDSTPGRQSSRHVRLLLQTKLGGHSCYNAPTDDANRCAFILDTCSRQ